MVRSCVRLLPAQAFTLVNLLQQVVLEGGARGTHVVLHLPLPIVLSPLCSFNVAAGRPAEPKSGPSSFSLDDPICYHSMGPQYNPVPATSSTGSLHLQPLFSRQSPNSSDAAKHGVHHIRPSNVAIARREIPLGYLPTYRGES
ncbi:hypothetical protein DE146DRAFT_511108 [Phaeosphaeria sp. MPI-PUGE-AT-0046c]|nr:hypothetical protein DE146DRAFT_511108 [Phaeosphaeria sp. MPI-PUGE-AT-0046c]